MVWFLVVVYVVCVRYRSSAEQFPIIVSQDCGHNPTADVIRSYEDKVIHIQVRHAAVDIVNVYLC